ncbi:MAG TPA: class I SAM-dependent methyltransferase [Acidobacteriaceae bacterium]|nr:class I SAM-dependent methyltransferase [Acidobacteriaceae bacterium]
MTKAPAFTPIADLQFTNLSLVIRQVQETEHRWFAQGDPKSPTLPWMPFQQSAFLAMLYDCIPEMSGRKFLDVGCGPGTKMQLAKHVYGLDVSGLEISPEMARAAGAVGTVTCVDALKAPRGTFSSYDLIWLYRPFRDSELEWLLESRIMKEMKPGAILAGGAWEICPADHKWVTVVDDWELRHGAWMKPQTA